MNDQLARIVTAFETASRRLHRLADRLIPAEAADRVDPKRWSVAEHVAHLNLTSDAYVPLTENGLLEARQIGGEAGRYRRDPMGWVLWLLVGPQPAIGRFRIGGLRTPPAFVPSGDRPFGEILAEFDRLQGALVSCVRSAEGLPIDRVFIESPFDRRVRYNLYSAFLIIPRHQLRHVAHAEGLWPARRKE